MAFALKKDEEQFSVQDLHGFYLDFVINETQSIFSLPVAFPLVGLEEILNRLNFEVI